MSRESELVYERYAWAFKPAPVESIPEWAKREVTVDKTSPISGKYNVDNSPYAEEWFLAWADPLVRKITTIGPNQGGRTKAMEVASLWSIANNPGPVQWNGKDNIKAKKEARERWWPMARQCSPVSLKLPQDSRIDKPVSFELTDGMPVTFQGASDGNLQEVSILTQFNDELFQWPLGMVANAWKRCDVSYAWNHKIWNGSVAGDEGDESEFAFNEGDKRDWTFICENPKCGHAQAFKWGRRNERGGIKWETSEKTKPGGKWDYKKVKKTAYYECEACQYRYADNNQSRKRMNKTGFYKPENPETEYVVRNGKRFYPFGENVSFRYNILAVNWPGLTWGKWVVEFLKALEQSERYASYELLKGFWARRMAQFWNESKWVNASREIVLGDYEIFGPDEESIYASQKWDDETFRFMAVDKQELGYFYVIRAVKAGGESRLIDRGELDSYNEIETKADEFQVPQNCVVIDARYETREVYAEAIKRGWLCLEGEDRKGYDHILRNKATKQRFKVVRVYSERKFGDPGFKFKKRDVLAKQYPGLVRANRQAPQYARYRTWSNVSVKDLLNGFKQGRTKIYWGIPSDVGKEYLKQINSEIRYKKTGNKGQTIYFWSNAGPDGKQRKKPNHYWDCECMLLVCMIMAKLIDLDRFQAGEDNEAIRTNVIAEAEDEDFKKVA